MFHTVLKYRSKVEYLNAVMGGKWKYDRQVHEWHCDDGRVVRRTAPPLDQFDNICGQSLTWLDTPGLPTRAFQWGLQ